MAIHTKPNVQIWTGRESEEELYLHEKVQLSGSKIMTEKSIAIFGYACDEGVKRNHGRVGAISGSNAIRAQLAKMPNHLDKNVSFVDYGNISCDDGEMESAQELLSQHITQLLKDNTFPILLGGGHDIAYGHYNGIREYLGNDTSIGIINFDAHFDLRSNENGNNSGTPFYQIAQECENEGHSFNYLCLGVRKDANDRVLFDTAKKYGVDYIDGTEFSMAHCKLIASKLLDFIRKVDHVYVTIDLDGFSSAYAPGVSAPSPMGFSPEVVIECLQTIIDSNKLISVDIVEMNPKYDIDNHTAKLAASLIHFVMHRMQYP